MPAAALAVALLGALVAFIPLAPASRASADARFTGVSSRLHSLTTVTPTIAEHAAHPRLAIVSAMAPWRSLEPTDDVFDWTQMDANVEDARAAGYQLIVRLMAGRIAPAWLRDAGAQHLRLLGTDQNASDYCDWIDVPVPWDPVLAAEYRELLHEVARWLGEPDGAGGVKGDHVALIPVAMPTMQGSEMVLGYGAGAACPAETDGAGSNLAATNRAVWDTVSTESERRALTEAAWRDAIAIHMSELPEATDSVVAYGALFGDGQAASRRIATEVVASYPERLWSMYTNLQPRVRNDGSLGPWREWCPTCHEVILAAIASGGAVGFQTAAGVPNDTLAKFSTAADDALATYGMRFLETQPNVIDRYEAYLLTGTGSLQDRLAAAANPPEPRPTQLEVGCEPATVATPTACTAVITDVGGAGATSPGGADAVTWSATGPDGFAGGILDPVACTPSGVDATASCSVWYTPTAGSAGTHTITAAYAGDAAHTGSTGQGSFTVGRRATSTTVACSSPVTLPSTSTCTATVTDAGSGTRSAPGGSVAWSTGGAGSFSSSSCSLAATSSQASSCSVAYTASVAGSHAISASYDGDIDHAASASAAFTLTAQAAPTGDVTAPSVAITSPVDGGAVPKGRKVTIAATATDNVRVTRVVFAIGGAVKCTDTSAPWTCAWTVPNTKKGTSTPYTLSATASDAAGNTATHTITVTAV